MGKFDGLKAVARSLGLKAAGRKLDPETSRAIDLAVDEFKHNLLRAVENGKLQSESAVVAESSRLQDKIRAEFARYEPLLMKMVSGSFETVQRLVLVNTDKERAKVRETVETVAHEALDKLTHEVLARSQELFEVYAAEVSAVKERCDQRLRAVEAAVIDACNLENAEKERRLAELREFLNAKEQEMRVAMEEEVASARTRIRQLAERQAEDRDNPSGRYGFRWVTVEERSTGRAVQVLASADGRELHCGACGGSECKHALKVAEALRSRPQA